MSRTTTDAAPAARPRAVAEALDRLASALRDAAADLVPGDAPAVVAFDPARNPEFGDFASNAALRLAKPARKAPNAVAADLAAAALARDPGLAELLALEPAGGFLNVRLAPAVWQRALAAVLRDGERFGRGEPTGRRVSLEFGSANPTGPILVVQGRTCSLGDSIANAMRYAGDDVFTEWVINDAGSQMDTLGRSLHARYRQIVEPEFPFPADGYPAAYLLPIAADVRASEGDRFDAAPEAEWLPFFASYGRDALVASQQATCTRFRVTYDLWQSERALRAEGAVEAAVAALAERGLTYESEGATWMRTTGFGDDKDRVLVRSDGRPTYFAPDVAYHRAKLGRGDRVVDILGPDHHGYVARISAVAAAFGRAGSIEVVITQLMTMLRDGEPVSMSKRAGDVLTLDDVIDEVGVDAARFFFVQTSADSPMTFDLTLAREQTNDNPVYYVQYAHARIASIERAAPPELLARAVAPGAQDVHALAYGGEIAARLAPLAAPAELALMRRLARYPETVFAVARTSAPHVLARYVQDLARDFTQFYAACKVLGVEPELTVARLALCRGTRTVLAAALAILGVSAPEAMSRLAAEEPNPQPTAVPAAAG